MAPSSRPEAVIADDKLQGFPAIILMDLRIVNDIHEPFFSELPEKAVPRGEKNKTQIRDEKIL